jgi:hypothetical protein
MRETRIKKGQYWAAKYHGQNGDLILGRVKSVRHSGEVILENLLADSKPSTKQTETLIQRNQRISKADADRILTTFRVGGKAAARKKAVEITREEPPPAEDVVEAKTNPLPRCYVCGAEATCCGEYEGATAPQFCCDLHCGHGNEDGWCCGIEEAVACLAAQRNALQAERNRLQESLPDDIRARGYSVAVHNDYRQDGVLHTFWLVTFESRCIKGEGRSDAEALEQIRHILRTGGP